MVPGRKRGSDDARTKINRRRKNELFLIRREHEKHGSDADESDP